MATSNSNCKGDLGFKAGLFKAAVKLRAGLEPSEYKHVALGLIFLKYISEAFEAQRRALLEIDGADPDWVFCKKDGERYAEGRRDAFESATRRAGLADLNRHDLRRTCGCRLLQDRGMKMHEVRDWLGHSTVRLTETTYAFLDVVNRAGFAGGSTS